MKKQHRHCEARRSNPGLLATGILDCFAMLAMTLGLFACAPYEKKLNIVEETPDALVVTPAQDCPNFSKDLSSDYENSPSSNFGCSTVTNYGAMLTNPRDMVKGRGNDADAQRSSVAVRAYNSGVQSGGTVAPTSTEGASTPSEAAQ